MYDKRALSTKKGTYKDKLFAFENPSEYHTCLYTTYTINAITYGNMTLILQIEKNVH